MAWILPTLGLISFIASTLTGMPAAATGFEGEGHVELHMLVSHILCTKGVFLYRVFWLVHSSVMCNW